MRNNRLMAVLVLAAAGAGCSPQSDDATATSTPPAEPQHVWKEQVQSLDKAKQVEQTLMDAHQRRAAEQPE